MARTTPRKSFTRKVTRVTKTGQRIRTTTKVKSTRVKARRK